MMKSILLAGAACAAMTSAAAAGDFAAEPVDVWSGYYVGVQGGFASGNLEVSAPDAVGVGYVDDIEGGFVGLYWGRNWQSGNLVFGLDGSFSIASLEDQNPVDLNAAEPDIEIELFSASRIRVGYAFDNLLLFAAGGFSLARADIEDNLVRTDMYLKGFTVGAGADYRFSGNWSARLEYMYINYGDESRTIDGLTYVVEAEDVHAVRAGVALHF